MHEPRNRLQQGQGEPGDGNLSIRYAKTLLRRKYRDHDKGKNLRQQNETYG